MKRILLILMMMLSFFGLSQFRNNDYDTILDFYKIKKQKFFNVKKYSKFKDPKEQLKADIGKYQMIENNLVVNSTLHKITNDLRKKNGLKPVSDEKLISKKIEDVNKSLIKEFVYDQNIENLVFKSILENPNCDCASSIFYCINLDFKDESGKDFSLNKLLLDPKTKSVSMAHYKIYKIGSRVELYTIIKIKRKGKFLPDHYFIKS